MARSETCIWGQGRGAGWAARGCAAGAGGCGAVPCRAIAYRAVWCRVWGLGLWDHPVQGVGSCSVGPYRAGCGAVQREGVLCGVRGVHRQPLF